VSTHRNNPAVAALAERFEVLDVLGEGGMGTVYRARTRDGDRLVALKVLHNTSERSRKRFLEREGALTASLRHPGIVRVHAAGEAGGLAYLAYELVEGGQPLAAVPGPAGRARFLEHVRQAAEAVGHAHAQGVIHRDLKPENVLVDAEGRARVADFGLAWAQGLERLTQTQALVGTPHYMAPEAYQGESHAPTLDVFSLGVVLYEGLTGRPPYEGETLLALAAAKTQGDVVPPRKIDPSVSPALNAVVLQALDPAPARRPPDGAALAAALREAERNPDAVPSFPTARPGVALALLTLALVLGGLTLTRPGETSSKAPVAASSPPPTSTTEPRPLSPARIERGARELQALKAPGDPASRVPALQTWLTDFAGHPDAEEARELLEVLRPLAPTRVLHLDLGDAWAFWAVWTEEGGLLVRHEGEAPSLTRWDAGGDAPSWTRPLPFARSTPTANRRGLLGASGEGLHVLNDVGQPDARRIPLRALNDDTPVRSFLAHPDGRRVLLGLSKQRILEVDLDEGTVLRRLRTQARPICDLAISPGGRWLAASSGEASEARALDPTMTGYLIEL
jgi:serine/threonine protein kinase